MTTDTPTKIALIGIGKIARDQHIPAMVSSKEWELAAAVSRNEKVDGIDNYSDFEEMLNERSDIKVVSLCMPPVPRFEYAKMALEAGRHVMLEKPPGATLSEVYALHVMANDKGLTLYATWHSREAAQVANAKTYLADKKLISLKIIWKEDVRRWHPGQDWIFEPGGMGVFDPGINALSILTEILPTPIHLKRAVLQFPENRQTPIAADLEFSHPDGAVVSAEFEWRHEGLQTWAFEIETDQGSLVLNEGGAKLQINGVEQSQPNDEALAGEYPRLYANMARLIATGESDVDTSPMRHVADAFTLGSRKSVPAFNF